MTLQQATLPTPQFDQIQLTEIKQQIEQTIQNGQNFLNQLSEVPQSPEAQLATLAEVDQLENNMSESWGILSHLNAVMNNADMPHARLFVRMGFFFQHFVRLGKERYIECVAHPMYNQLL